jgi:hypothetical protein
MMLIVAELAVILAKNLFVASCHQNQIALALLGITEVLAAWHKVMSLRTALRQKTSTPHVDDLHLGLGH